MLRVMVYNWTENKIACVALDGGLDWLERSPIHEKVAGLIPG